MSDAVTLPPAVRMGRHAATATALARRFERRNGVRGRIHPLSLEVGGRVAGPAGV